MQLSKQLDEETKFMLYGEPGERKFTAEQQEQMIQRFVENKYAAILVAVEEERIVGFILVNGNHIQRKRHGKHCNWDFASIVGEVLGLNCLKRSRSGQDYMVYGV